ncbi:hypothetical protein [Ferrigenium sp. UT5]|uniref:hypothetical protein n=1 Tax=Ferrigenium sp. UT5 TaxID=3242105 RepID=UPI0035518C26
MSGPEEFAPDIPLLTEIAGNPADDLPLLTDVAQETPPAPPPDIALNAEPRLQQTLETYLETVFAEKLKAHLAIAQQWAIDAAITELKNELPQLIRKAQDRTDMD